MRIVGFFAVLSLSAAVEIPPKFRSGCLGAGDDALVWAYTSLLGVAYEDWWTGESGKIYYIIITHFTLSKETGCMERNRFC